MGEQIVGVADEPFWLSGLSVWREQQINVRLLVEAAWIGKSRGFFFYFPLSRSRLLSMNLNLFLYFFPAWLNIIHLKGVFVCENLFRE